jgi:hypothetical protein
MAEAIIGVCGTLAGALLGVVGTVIIQKQSTRRSDSQVARIQLSDLWAHIWADRGSWGDLKIELARLRVRLQNLGVPDSDWDLIADLAVKCWRDSSEALDHSGGQEAGISGRLHDEFEGACQKVDRYLATL